METEKKRTNKSIIIIAMLGVVAALLWQFGGTLLKEGPLADLSKSRRAAAPVNTTWEYKQAKDSKTGATIKGATLNSTNTADTGFGPTGRMVLILTNLDGNKNVAVHNNQGVLLCASSPDKCSVDIQFDNGDTETIKAFYSKQNLILDDPDKLIGRIKKAKTVKVDVVFVTGKGKINNKFDFATEGLEWKD